MFNAVQEICNHSFVKRLISDDAIVVDLGANHGEFCHAIIQQFHCKVVAVEPVQELFDSIERHPFLSLHHLAVGGKNKVEEMNVFPKRCASALRQLSSDEQVKRESVEMVTLGELLRRAFLDHVDLLKIDIEGAEIDLFDNSSDQQLQSIMQITIEFHDFLYPEQAPDIVRIKDRMRQIGFWVVAFSLDNSNILFINRRTGIGNAEVVYLKSVVKYGKGIARRFLRRPESPVYSSRAPLPRFRGDLSLLAPSI